jgi:hypothetical protein
MQVAVFSPFGASSQYRLRRDVRPSQRGVEWCSRRESVAPGDGGRSRPPGEAVEQVIQLTERDDTRDQQSLLLPKARTSRSESPGCGCHRE